MTKYCPKTGKVIHSSKIAAQSELARNGKHVRLEVYHCSSCDGYHVAHRIGAKQN